MPLKLVHRGKVWYIRGTVRGGIDARQSKTIFVSTGTDDKRAAEAIRIKTEASILNDSIFGSKVSKTFLDGALSFIASGGSNRFVGTDKEGMCGKFAHRVMDTITQDDLDKAARELYPTALSETKIRQFYTPFIAIWNHAARQGWCTPRKWQRPRKLKGTNVVVARKYRSGNHPVEYERAAQFVAAMSPAPAMLMTALFYTGMRPIELLALDCKDVNVDKRWLVVSNSKTGEPRGVPIHDFVVPLFESLLKRGGKVFRTQLGRPYQEKDDGGGQLKTAIIGARMRLARQAHPDRALYKPPHKLALKQSDSPIRDISPYTARHTVSTELVVQRVHPHIKDQILGHAVTDMSHRYTNIPQAPLIEAINALPVPALWRSFDWWEDPLGWSDVRIEGAGYRYDLEQHRIWGKL